MSSYICFICKDLLMEPQKVVSGVTVLTDLECDPFVTYCGHVFHRHCMEKWVAFQKVNNRPLTCYYCLERILATDVVRVYPSTEGNMEKFSTLKERMEKHNRVIESMSEELNAATSELSLIENEMEEMQTLSNVSDTTIKGLQGRLNESKRKHVFGVTDRVSLQNEIKCLKAQCEEYEEKIREKIREKRSVATSDEFDMKSVSHTLKIGQPKQPGNKKRRSRPKKGLGKVNQILGSPPKGEDKH